MEGRFWKWLGGVFAEHTFMQLIAAMPFAYLLGTVIQIMQGVETMMDALPYLFWPILACLVLAVTVYPGFVKPAVKLVRARKEHYLAVVKATYGDVLRVLKPKILNPNAPGNHQAMLELAQQSVDSLRPILIRKYKNDEDRNVPSRIDILSEDSLRQWYEFLREERVIAGEGLKLTEDRPYG